MPQAIIQLTAAAAVLDQRYRTVNRELITFLGDDPRQRGYYSVRNEATGNKVAVPAGYKLWTIDEQAEHVRRSVEPLKGTPRDALEGVLGGLTDEQLEVLVELDTRPWLSGEVLRRLNERQAQRAAPVKPEPPPVWEPTPETKASPAFEAGAGAYRPGTDPSTIMPVGMAGKPAGDEWLAGWRDAAAKADPPARTTVDHFLGGPLTQPPAVADAPPVTITSQGTVDAEESELVPEAGGRSAAFMRGREAFMAGADPSANPYEGGTQKAEFADWLRGYTDAMEPAKSEPRFVRPVVENRHPFCPKCSAEVHFSIGTAEIGIGACAKAPSECAAPTCDWKGQVYRWADGSIRTMAAAADAAPPVAAPVPPIAPEVPPAKTKTPRKPRAPKPAPVAAPLAPPTEAVIVPTGENGGHRMEGEGPVLDAATDADVRAEFLEVLGRLPAKTPLRPWPGVELTPAEAADPKWWENAAKHPRAALIEEVAAALALKEAFGAEVLEPEAAPVTQRPGPSVAGIAAALVALGLPYEITVTPKGDDSCAVRVRPNPSADHLVQIRMAVNDNRPAGTRWILDIPGPTPEPAHDARRGAHQMFHPEALAFVDERLDYAPDTFDRFLGLVGGVRENTSAMVGITAADIPLLDAALEWERGHAARGTIVSRLEAKLGALREGRSRGVRDDAPPRRQAAPTEPAVSAPPAAPTFQLSEAGAKRAAEVQEALAQLSASVPGYIAAREAAARLMALDIPIDLARLLP